MRSSGQTPKLRDARALRKHSRSKKKARCGRFRAGQAKRKSPCLRKAESAAVQRARIAPFEPLQAEPVAPVERAAGPDKVAYFEVAEHPSSLDRLGVILYRTPRGPSETRSCSGLNSAPARVAFSPRTEQVRLPESIPTQSAPASLERSYAYFKAYLSVAPVSLKTCRLACLFAILERSTVK